MNKLYRKFSLNALMIMINTVFGLAMRDRTCAGMAISLGFGIFNTVSRRTLSPKLYPPREFLQVLHYITWEFPSHLQSTFDPLEDIWTSYWYLICKVSITGRPRNIHRNSSV